MISDFRWNEWNLEHATKHGVSIAEIESVVRDVKRPYPMKKGDGKWVVIGRGNGGRFIEVIFVVDPDKRVYVIHAMQVYQQ